MTNTLLNLALSAMTVEARGQVLTLCVYRCIIPVGVFLRGSRVANLFLLLHRVAQRSGIQMFGIRVNVVKCLRPSLLWQTALSIRRIALLFLLTIKVLVIVVKGLGPKAV